MDKVAVVAATDDDHEEKVEYQDQVSVKVVQQLVLHNAPVDLIVTDNKSSMVAAASTQESRVMLLDARDPGGLAVVDQVTVEGRILDLALTASSIAILTLEPLIGTFKFFRFLYRKQ